MKREDTGTKAIVRAQCRAFLLTESVHCEESVRMELHFSTLASKLAYKISNARNTKYILTSRDGDVQTTILMGRPVKTISVTIKDLKLWYKTLN